MLNSGWRFSLFKLACFFFPKKFVFFPFISGWCEASLRLLLWLPLILVLIVTLFLELNEFCGVMGGTTAMAFIIGFGSLRATVPLSWWWFSLLGGSCRPSVISPFNQYVCISPFPFIETSPRLVTSNVPNRSRICFVVWLMWIFNASPLDSIRLAVFTVSPNKQYLGILEPTTPAQQGPEWRPMRSFSFSSGRWRITKLWTLANKARAMRAISRAWRSPFLTGSPDTWNVLRLTAICLTNVTASNTYNHISIANSFHLVDIKVSHNFIEACVKII